MKHYSSMPQIPIGVDRPPGYSLDYGWVKQACHPLSQKKRSQQVYYYLRALTAHHRLKLLARRIRVPVMSFLPVPATVMIYPKCFHLHVPNGRSTQLGGSISVSICRIEACSFPTKSLPAGCTTLHAPDCATLKVLTF